MWIMAAFIFANLEGNEICMGSGCWMFLEI